ncbi:MAG: hypothetical protein KDE56_31160, partial [Anaerolineales bacterium]|nr:hypothetical protein [Anaerolineales bacterium]
MSDYSFDIYICPYCGYLLPKPHVSLIGAIKPVKCRSCEKNIPFRDIVFKSYAEYAEDIGIAAALRKYEPSLKLNGFSSKIGVYLNVTSYVSNNESIAGGIRVLGPRSNAGILDHDYDILWITTEKLLHMGVDRVNLVNHKLHIASYQYPSITSILNISGGFFERSSINISLSSGNTDKFIVPNSALVTDFVKDVQAMIKHNKEILKNEKGIAPIVAQLEKLSELYKQKLLNDEEYR